MELVECGSLKEVLAERGRLPWREAAEVALQVCGALSHAHQHGCIHRDLKPANIYLSEDGFMKLGDLGSARDLNDSRITTSGPYRRDVAVHAPQQISAEDQIDGRLDIYALGCILFEMAGGARAVRWAELRRDFRPAFGKHSPAVGRGGPDCPGLADLVDQMLEKKPACATRKCRRGCRCPGRNPDTEFLRTSLLRRRPPRFLSRPFFRASRPRISRSGSRAVLMPTPGCPPACVGLVLLGLAVVVGLVLALQR